MHSELFFMRSLHDDTFLSASLLWKNERNVYFIDDDQKWSKHSRYSIESIVLQRSLRFMVEIVVLVSTDFCRTLFFLYEILMGLHITQTSREKRSSFPSLVLNRFETVQIDFDSFDARRYSLIHFHHELQVLPDSLLSLFYPPQPIHRWKRIDNSVIDTLNTSKPWIVNTINHGDVGTNKSMTLKIVHVKILAAVMTKLIDGFYRWYLRDQYWTLISRIDLFLVLVHYPPMLDPLAGICCFRSFTCFRLESQSICSMTWSFILCLVSRLEQGWIIWGISRNFFFFVSYLASPVIDRTRRPRWIATCNHSRTTSALPLFSVFVLA